MLKSQSTAFVWIAASTGRLHIATPSRDPVIEFVNIKLYSTIPTDHNLKGLYRIANLNIYIHCVTEIKSPPPPTPAPVALVFV